MRRSQRGVTFLGWLLLLTPVAIVIYAGIRLTPVYLNYMRVARSLDRLHALGRPLLLAVSRKDFVGAITRRATRARLAGTLAAISHGLDQGAHILRVHDVAQVVDFLSVRAVLDGDVDPEPGLRLSDHLRWEQGQ